MKGRLFATDSPAAEWVTFRAEGFSEPVTGVIHRRAKPATNGMPLGGIDTGCIDLETSGLWGYSTIFNTHVPRRGPINLPFLGLSVGGTTWVLCDPKQTKPYLYLEDGESHPLQPAQCCQVEESAIQAVRSFNGAQPPYPVPRLELEGVRTPQEIHYWGHYPVADLEYVTDAPVEVGLRAWASFLPGNIEESLIPGAVFEVHLRNTTDSVQKGTVAFSIPGPLAGEAGEGGVIREEVHGVFNGIHIKAPKVGYALGVIGHEPLRMGGELGADGEAWAEIARALPDTLMIGRDRMGRTEEVKGSLGSSAAVDFELESGERKVVRFVLTWHGPQWKGGGYNWSQEGRTYTHMYVKHCPTAAHAAFKLGEEHESLLRRILAWQEVIYTDPELPPWLQEVLVNNFHLITEVGLWAQAGPPIGDWCRPEDGLWALDESPRGCPQFECGGNTYYGGMAEQYFFPQLVQSTLRAHLAYQYPDGCPTWIFGGVSGRTPPLDMVEPTRGYQTGVNGSFYVGLFIRHWMRTGDDEFLREAYPSLKRATTFTFNMNPERPYGLLALPDFDLQEGYESIPFKGICSHVGSLRLYHLKMMEKIAEHMGDPDSAAQFREWFRQTSRLMEEHLWTGSYYLQSKDPATGNVNDAVMGYQLDGEFMACHDGIPEGVFPPERTKTVLATLREAADDNWGTRVWSDPEGGPVKKETFDTGYWYPSGVHAPGALMLAMTYMYRGEKEHGLELARKVLENMVCRQGWTWDMPILYRGDTGEGMWGNDYAQMMMCWALPAAVVGQDLGSYARSPDGLVDRIMRVVR